MTKLMRSTKHENNFDLLRLAAAFQVLHFHVVTHLHIAQGALGRSLTTFSNFFPGVPIFFVISGFLISSSYERVPDLRTYVRNRFLRIYPALWVCLAVTLAILAAVGLLRGWWMSREFLAWLVAQTTFVQFYNPAHLRGFGVGVINGSLWTIPVELSFYVLLPLLYWVVTKQTRARANILVIALTLASFAIWWAASRKWELSHPAVAKLLGVTPIPHVHLFLFGVLVQRNFETLRVFVAGRVALWTALYVALMTFQVTVLDDGLRDNPFFLLTSRTILGFWTLSFAYSYRSVSQKVLQGHDVSYGLYIYHGLVLNLVRQYLGIGSYAYYAVVLAGGAILATLSWTFVERPILRKKVASPPRLSLGVTNLAANGPLSRATESRAP